MRGVHIFNALLLCLPLAAQVFRTGDPVIALGSGSMVHPLTPNEYQKYAAAAAGRSNVIIVRRLPSGLGADYRVGYNFVYDSANHGWILDRDSEGYRLFLDLRGDGDLANSQPLRFHDESGARRIDIPMREGATQWTARFELVQSSGDKDHPSIRVIQETNREGKVLVDGREIPFRLSGSSGKYDRLGNHVFFDRDGSGKYESYNPEDRWVNLAGKTYEFSVDPQGESLTLQESASHPDRPSLEAGTAIPDISLTDLAGKPHAFRRNTAEVTLLEFWNTNCGPCREEMPNLKALYDRQTRSRFEIIGVTSDESEDVLKKYLAEFAIPWPECREADDGPVHQLMRIDGIPAYFLLSHDGTILDSWVGAGPTISKIEAALK